MGHYAKVVDQVVTQVIVANSEFMATYDDGTGVGKWIKTSYNTKGGIHYEPGSNYTVVSKDQSKALRYNFASKGNLYDEEADAFYRARDAESQVLNTDTYLWEPPFPAPDDGKEYYWSEAHWIADNTTGWVEDVEPEQNEKCLIM